MPPLARGLNAEGLLGIFYVLDFGATGDGQHDDAGGIQAAVLAAGAAGGGLVAIPAGTYRLGSNVVWGNAANVTIWQHSGVTFTGPGALPAAAGSNAIRAEPSGATVGGVPTTSVPGDVAAAGASGIAADVGHRHGREGSAINHSVNGLLNVWQRPVQAYTANNGPAGPDGLFITLAGTDTISCTQDTANADAANGAQFSLACAFTLGTGAGASGVQSLLGGFKLTTDLFRFWRGRQVTRSWRVRASVANAVRLAVTTDGTGGTTTLSAFHPGDNTWQTLSVTTPAIPADATFVQFKVVCGASTTFYVGAHATAVGAVGADPYAAALSPPDDVARCLRYYEVLGSATSFAPQINGVATAAGQGFGATVPYHARKAVTPTATKVGTWNAGNCGQPSLTADADLVFLQVTSVAAGAVASYPNAAGQYISIEANP